jgi:hypothetical protein
MRKRVCRISGQWDHNLHREGQSPWTDQQRMRALLRPRPRNGFDSVLTLTSNFSSPQSFSVSVFSRPGKKIAGPTLPMQHQKKISVSIADWLRSLSADPTGEFAEGSVAVNFTADNGKSLMGQIVISNPTTGMNFISRMFKNNQGQTGLPPTLNLLWCGVAHTSRLTRCVRVI